MENAILSEPAAAQSPGYIMQLLENLGNWLLKAGLRLLLVAVCTAIGLKLIRAFRKGLGRSMERAGMEVTIRKFLDALLYAVLLGLLFFLAAEGLGIQATSLLTLVSSITLAIGLAMRDALANFAGGVLILVLKPFKVGDYITASDVSGTVESIGLVYTTLSTMENIKIVIPNNGLANSALTNTTGMEKKRLILPVRISYSADLKKAKEILSKLLEDHPSILKEEGIVVIVDSLGEHAVNLSVRGWTKTEDYWQTRWDILEAVKLAFDREGIEIPYEHLDVRVASKQ